MDRLCLVGPVLPFRGGIAQHTTMLHRTIAKQQRPLTVSFSRQYPRWLYPGKSDRDPSYESHVESGVEYLIDSLRPWTWKQAVRLILDEAPDVVMVPWWTVYWAPCFLYLIHRVRAAGIRVCVLCHNTTEHESNRVKKAISLRVLASSDIIVVHAKADARELEQSFPDKLIKFHPHPIYDQFPSVVSRLPRRASLELLFFGFVRPYKGLDILLDAMKPLHDVDVFLTVAGEFWDSASETKRRVRELNLEGRIEIRDRFQSDQECAQLFDRADLVVLPYRSATGSGVIPIAYHYDTPVLVTDVGGLPDVVVEGETGFIVPSNSPSAIAASLRMADRALCSSMIRSIQEYKRRLTWSGLVETIMFGS